MAPSDSEADRPELDAPAMHGRKLHGRLEGNPKPASWPTARRIQTNPAAHVTPDRLAIRAPRPAGSGLSPRPEAENDPKQPIHGQENVAGVSG